MRPVHDHPARVYCCPECGSSDIWEREFKAYGIRVDDDERHICYECKREFEEPAVRSSGKVTQEGLETYAE